MKSLRLSISAKSFSIIARSAKKAREILSKINIVINLTRCCFVRYRYILLKAGMQKSGQAKIIPPRHL
jgi:hypothetical protein